MAGPIAPGHYAAGVTIKRLNKVGWKRGDAGEFLAVRVAGGAGKRFRRLRVVADVRFFPLQSHRLERL